MARKVGRMSENEAIKVIRAKACNDRCTEIHCNDSCMYGKDKCAFDMAIKALEEIQQYRAIGTVEDIQTMKDNGSFSAVELAKIAVMLKRLKDYEAIGTVEDIQKVLAFLDGNVANIRAKAIDEFAEKLKEPYKEILTNNDCGIDCKPCLNEFLKEIDDIAEQMKAGEIDG